MLLRFPVVLSVGPLQISAHAIFESLGYTVGFWLHRYLKRRQGDFLPSSDRYTVIVAAILGAAIGSKFLNWFEDPFALLHHLFDLNYLLSGKTIVGGLLGATLAVEWIKRRSGITRRTGDLFALPIIAGMAIGRIGCFLAGLPDGTCGTATSLPWGVDFGDGIHRHPTQLYEVGFLLVLGLWIERRSRSPHREGDLFRLFFLTYLLFRIAIDFLKPGVTILGMTAIQWSCVIAILAYWRDIFFWLAPRSIRAEWEIASALTSSTTPPSPSAPPVIGEATPR